MATKTIRQSLGQNGLFPKVEKFYLGQNRIFANVEKFLVGIDACARCARRHCIVRRPVCQVCPHAGQVESVRMLDMDLRCRACRCRVMRHEQRTSQVLRRYSHRVRALLLLGHDLRA